MPNLSKFRLVRDVAADVGVTPRRAASIGGAGKGGVECPSLWSGTGRIGRDPGEVGWFQWAGGACGCS